MTLDEAFTIKGILERYLKMGNENSICHKNLVDINSCARCVGAELAHKIIDKEIKLLIGENRI